jgi:hypothetical protein
VDADAGDAKDVHEQVALGAASGSTRRNYGTSRRCR